MRLKHPKIFYFFILVVIFFSSCSEEKKRPNILFAISDDQSFFHTSFAGRTWVKTPAFDKIASQGIYFTNCYAGSPGCAPSRSAIVTGRYPWQNEQAGQHAAGWLEKYVPFVDLLAANGYHTGHSGKGVDPFQYDVDSLGLRKENAAGKTYNKLRYKAESPEDERYADGINRVNYFANFKKFLEEQKGNKNQAEEEKPFFFWYGGYEPHRSFEQDSWKKRGKNLQDVEVPGFLPDVEEIRGDLLDYAVEIEWFDMHLGRMVDYLEEIGELDNTIIIVTSDNGMSFPRAKANAYEYGFHVPLAISFPKNFPGGRQVDDLISFVDLAPTILELTETEQKGMLPITGKSFVSILKSDQEGIVDESRDAVYTGRERHSSSRYQNLGYPQRAMRQGRFLYVWNMKPERWPAGAPQSLVSDSTEELNPMYGIDEEGVHHSEWAFTDIDECPTKSFMVEHHDDPKYKQYFDLAVGKRAEFELFDVVKDPYCMTNLATDPEFNGIANQMKNQMMQELQTTEDPRMVGPNKEIFDTYPRYSPIREFPKPDWIL